MDLKTHDSNNVKVLAISGRFDIQSAYPVRIWLDEATSSDPAHIVVNLSDVQFLDSTGLSTLVDGLKRSRSNNGDLHLCGLQHPVRMIFELTRLDKVFQIYLDEDAAISGFGN